MRKSGLFLLCIIMVGTVGCSKKESAVGTNAPETELTAICTEMMQETTAETNAETTAETTVGETTIEVQSPYTQELSELPDELQKVIFEGATFYNSDSKKDETLSSISTYNNSTEAVGDVVWNLYAVRDIDMDGDNELIA